MPCSLSYIFEIALDIQNEEASLASMFLAKQPKVKLLFVQFCANTELINYPKKQNTFRIFFQQFIQLGQV